VETTKIGVKVRVNLTTAGCCGVIQQGWTGTIAEIYKDKFPRVIVLEDGTLCWENHIEVIQ